MDRKAKLELAEELRARYGISSKDAKTRILDEFVKTSGYHRKYALRLLGHPTISPDCIVPSRRRVYDGAVKEALIVLWEASDRICGKRLKAILPELLKSLESHEHLKLDSNVRELLLVVSAASIDRLLRSIRSQAGGRTRRRTVGKIRSLVKVKTFGDWEDARPGSTEIDFVAHCGGTLTGSFIHSLVMTDVASGWTEATPLLVREQSLVVEGLSVLRGRIPIPLLGINSDNDSAFINESVVAFCDEQKVVFTRSRPYRKNDQFLSQLPRLWQQGEVRPTHREPPTKARDYRTREDPFEGVWSQLLSWIEKEPDATGKALFDRLQELHPGRFPDGQLRTLQRRVRQWRHMMAKQLIYKTVET